MGVKVVDFQSVSPQAVKMVAAQESTIRPDPSAGLKAIGQGLEDTAATLGKIADKFTAAGALQQKTSEAKAVAADNYSDALTNYNVAKAEDTKGFNQEQLTAHNERLAFLKKRVDDSKFALDEATSRDNRAGLFGFSSENSWMSTRWKTDVYRQNQKEEK
jgi:hypothetical protein